MPHISVVLDTNALFGDPFWSGSSTRKLLSLGREVGIDIVVSEVVLLELNRQAVQEVVAQQRSLTSAWGAFFPTIEQLALDAARLGLTREKPEKLGRVEIESLLTNRIRLTLDDAGVVRLPLPAVGHEELLERDLSGRKPFDQNGKGYRDALIWHSILEYAGTRPGLSMYLVSSDNDFGSNGSMDEALLRELPEGVSLSRVTTIEGLLELSPFTEVFDRRELEGYQQSLDEIVAEAVTSAVEELEDHPLSSENCESLDIPREVYDVSITSPSTVVDEVEWAPYESLDGTTVLGEASAAITFAVMGNVVKHDFGVLADDNVSILDLTDDYAQVQIDDLEGRVVFAVRAELPDMVEIELSRFDFRSPH